MKLIMSIYLFTHTKDLYKKMDNSIWLRQCDSGFQKTYIKEQDYLFSSARNYYNLPNVLEIDCLTPPVTTSSSYNFFNPW